MVPGEEKFPLYSLERRGRNVGARKETWIGVWHIGVVKEPLEE
jgi:hypothetical protein